MEMKSILLICLLFSINVAASSNFPSSFKKCDRKQTDFNQCLVAAVEDAIHQMNKPIPEVGFPNLEPLVLGNVSTPSGKKVAFFEQNYQNYKIFGLTALNLTKFDVFFENKTINMECFYKYMRLEFDYNFKGKILLVPFHGEGPGRKSFRDVTFFLTFVLDEYENEGKKYYKVVNSTLKADTKEIVFQLENLFHETDDLLGVSNLIDVNSVFNENWELIFYDLKDNYEPLFAQAFAAIFNQLLEKVPIDELFGAN